jgi:hypothetical protein
MHSLYLLQHVLADLHSHHQVVVQIHKNKKISETVLHFTDTTRDILSSWLLFQILQQQQQQQQQ